MGCYFLRFIESEEHAVEDLRRGWSMVAAGDRGYLESLDAEGLFELMEHPFLEGEWALKIDGLCGYGPFDSVEDAKAAAIDLWSNPDDEPWLESPLCAVYSGTLAGYDGMAGDLFRPESIVEFLNR